jgi:glycosyltransferase involved in cell wall biosynthesis
MPISISFVIPTYNRCNSVQAAIDSAITWIDQFGGGEIIVVDDASTDQTVDFIQSHYHQNLQSGMMQLVALAANVGVCGAKNAGGLKAKGRWIIFLDSDDTVIADAAMPAMDCLKRHNDKPCVMFRSRDLLKGIMAGAQQVGEQLVDLKHFINSWTFSECLPVVRADVFRAYPFPADLRGYEGLAYAGMIQEFGALLVSPTIARRYETTGSDRLSSGAGMARRAASLARGHWRMLTGYWRFFSIKNLVYQVAKILYYGTFAFKCVFKDT